MHEAEPHALARQPLDHLGVVRLEKWMSGAAIGVKDHRRRSVEVGIVFGPPLVANLHREPRPAAKALLEQEAAGPELMLAGSVAGLAGDQDDLLVRRQGTHGQEGSRSQPPQEELSHNHLRFSPKQRFRGRREILRRTAKKTLELMAHVRPARKPHLRRGRLGRIALGDKLAREPAL